MLQLIFIGLTILSFALFHHGTGQDKKVLIFFVFWFVVTGILSYSGFLKKTNALPPRILFVLLTSTIYVIYFFKTINTDNLKLKYLLLIHTLRLPVELTLYQLFLQGKIPIIMTYKGWNFDILVGITAIIILLSKVFFKKELNNNLFKVWNIFGLVFLTIIVITAILSAPSPLQQFAFAQPNIALLEFPYSFLPAIVVPVVLLSHLLYFKHVRQLRAGRKNKF